MRLFLSLLCLFLIAAAPVDPVLQQVVAGARTVPPASIAFERTSKTVARDTKGATQTETATDRWDGKQLVRLTTNGKPASAEEMAKFAKTAKGRPIPGYHRIALYLGSGARRISEKPGQIVYRVDRLPKGSIDISGDRSDKFAGEATVDTSGPVPFVSRLHLFAPKPFSIMMVAKIDKFDVLNSYETGKDGRPVMVRAAQSMAGAQFGTAGEQRTDSVYTPLR